MTGTSQEDPPGYEGTSGIICSKPLVKHLL